MDAEAGYLFCVSKIVTKSILFHDVFLVFRTINCHLKLADFTMTEKKRTIRQSPLPSKDTEVIPSAEAIYERIVQAIMEHRLLPGTKLTEEKLSSVFGVNRTRVREVLLRLAHEGLVSAIPNRGAYVASPSVEEARQTFEARRILEPALVRKLALTASKSDIKQLREHVTKERKARADGENRAVIRLSGEFHLLMAEMVGIPQLTKVLRELASLTCLIILLYDSPKVSACLNHEHGDLIDAIEARDEARAVQCMIEHLDHIEQSLNLSTDDEQDVDLMEIFS